MGLVGEHRFYTGEYGMLILNPNSWYVKLGIESGWLREATNAEVAEEIKNMKKKE